jgi:Gas vesicle synthesis protein GvpL/GvpF
VGVNCPPTAEPPACATALYCYGITWAKAARAQPDTGVSGESVEPVVHQELAALTSGVGSTKVRPRRRDLLNHSNVLSAALEQGTVLPLRFGIVFENEAELVDGFLRPRHDELTALLRTFEGRVELTVKAYYREEAILAEIVRENPRIARLRRATRGAGEVSAFPLRVELGERTAGELETRTRRDRHALLDRLRPLALESKVDEEWIEHQVLRASFLVEREHVPAFDEVMNEIAQKEAPRMHFKYTGPLAPHSFVSLRPAEGH